VLEFGLGLMIGLDCC